MFIKKTLIATDVVNMPYHLVHYNKRQFYIRKSVIHHINIRKEELYIIIFITGEKILIKFNNCL